MLLSELFQKLSFGELSNLALTNDGNGTIVEGKQAKLIGYTNDALLRLYSRFVLRENDLLLQVQAAQRSYPLDRKYALINPDRPPETVGYIIDSVTKPFEDDVIKILMVLNSDGQQLPLNDPHRADSVFTPQPTVLQVSSPVDQAMLGIAYQARHPRIPIDNDLSAEVTVPAVLEEALQCYIAHLVFSHMNGQENSSKGAEYLNTFEMLSQGVEASDLVSNSYSSTNTRFAQGGWI